MIAKIESACLIGMDAARVQVEVSLAKGAPTFSMVGLPDASVREAKDRVVAAIRNTGFEFPSRRVTVNLAPADLRKEGACFDLAIAIGILMASEALTPKRWPRGIWLGELALDGSIRPVRGALPLARSLARQPGAALVLPQGNLDEVSFLSGVDLYPFLDLRSVVQWLHAPGAPKPSARTVDWKAPPVQSARRSCGDQRTGDGQTGTRRSPRPAATICFWSVLREPANPCWLKHFREFCRPGIFRTLWTRRRSIPRPASFFLEAVFFRSGLTAARIIRYRRWGFWAAEIFPGREKFRSRIAASSFSMNSRSSAGIRWKRSGSLWSRPSSTSIAPAGGPPIPRTLF